MFDKEKWGDLIFTFPFYVLWTGYVFYIRKFPYFMYSVEHRNNRIAKQLVWITVGFMGINSIKAIYKIIQMNEKEIKNS